MKKAKTNNKVLIELKDVASIRENLKKKKLSKTEAVDLMARQFKYGRQRAIQLVNIFLEKKITDEISSRRYNPSPCLVRKAIV